MRKDRERLWLISEEQKLRCNWAKVKKMILEKQSSKTTKVNIWVKTFAVAPTYSVWKKTVFLVGS